MRAFTSVLLIALISSFVIANAEINVCFVIDGSASVGAGDFKNMKSFVVDLHSILGVEQPVSYAAVQFGNGIREISPPTLDRLDFPVKVSRSKYWNASSSDIATGMFYCFKQLIRRRGDVRVMVLLTDGGPYRGRDPLLVANQFHRRGGQIYAVYTGSGRVPGSLLDIVGQDSDSILGVFDAFDLADTIDVLRRN